MYFVQSIQYSKNKLFRKKISSIHTEYRAQLTAYYSTYLQISNCTLQVRSRNYFNTSTGLTSVDTERLGLTCQALDVVSLTAGILLGRQGNQHPCPARDSNPVKSGCRMSILYGVISGLLVSLDHRSIHSAGRQTVNTRSAANPVTKSRTQLEIQFSIQSRQQSVIYCFCFLFFCLPLTGCISAKCCRGKVSEKYVHCMMQMYLQSSAGDHEFMPN